MKILAMKFVSTLTNIGSSLQTPIAILPAAGLLLALGAVFTNPDFLEMMPFTESQTVINIFAVCLQCGGIIFSNLPLIFAAGVAIGLTNNDGVAALSAIVGYLIMNVTIGGVLGITSDMIQLSGGQKQLTAIAGAIAIRTQCIVLDEPTAKLDPQGRNAVMKALKELHEKYNITIIIITHFMEEAVQADRIIVMNDGKIIQDGMPKDIFKQKENLKKIGLSVPLAVDIVDALQKKGLKLANVFDNENLAKELQQLISK